MKCILSGGSGFIGRHLALRLLAEGHQVKLLNRIILADPVQLSAYMEFEKPDYIFHLASYGNHSHQKDEDVTFVVNLEYGWNLLKATKDIPYKKFINFGSSSEYGRCEVGMVEDFATYPETVYGATKAGMTNLCITHAKRYNKPITTIRPFSVYGEGEASFRFIPKVIESLRTGQTFPLDPYANHDWIYVEDFIDGVMAAVNGNEAIVNIGTGQQHTNMEIVNILEEISGRKAVYTLVDTLRGYDSPNWYADNSRLKSLGWRQKHSLREGLRETYERTA